jgi:uncharacterized protein YeaO (DUF488 family)
MHILPVRVYQQPQPAGYRVLVDRLWPRGLTKQAVAEDEWAKTLAPSSALRQWFGHQPAKWAEFSRRYQHELIALKPQALALLKRAHPGPLVLLYAAKDDAHTHALILKQFLENLQPPA